MVGLAISDDVARWDDMGMIHEVLFRVRLVETTERDRVEVRLNGKALPENRLRRIINMYAMDAPVYRVTGACWYVFRLEGEYLPVCGANTVEVTLLEQESEAHVQPKLRDVEMEIKYLRGRGFGRGKVDPDLGLHKVGMP